MGPFVANCVEIVDDEVKGDSEVRPQRNHEAPACRERGPPPSGISTSRQTTFFIINRFPVWCHIHLGHEQTKWKCMYVCISICKTNFLFVFNENT